MKMTERRDYIVKYLVKVILAVLVVTLAYVTGAQAVTKVGDIIQFGDWDWRVLDLQDDRALIITEHVIERRPYHVEPAHVTWETCILRRYLNGEFLQKFKEEEQRRIAETSIQNSDNLWFDTKGGKDTTDKVFLLSLEEIDRYFGDSGDYQNKRRKTYEGQYPSGKWVPSDGGYAFSNANDSDRIAKHNNQPPWWWLRSPGDNSFNAAYVNGDGSVFVYGSIALYDTGGVRPALWLNQ